MNNLARNLLILMVSMLVSSHSYASLVFSFNEVGGNIAMTTTGVLDTNNLVARTNVDTWGGTGVEENGNNDILGGTSFGQVNASFAFNDGTDFSAWEAATGPFSQSFFGWTVDAGGTTSFTTYVRSNDTGIQIPGFGLRIEDLVGGLWTANQNWTLLGMSFADIGLNIGTYTVSDFLTNESITIEVAGNVSAVPVPAAAWLFGTGILGLMAARRKKKLTA